MATTFNFNGRIIKLAGIYSRITSGVKNAPLSLDYGKVLVVDTGSGAGWGFGAGVLGTLENGADAVYSDITDQGLMKAAVRGGIWWKLAEPLFKPEGATSNGASEVEWARAATTVPATMSFAFTGGITNTQTCVTVILRASTSPTFITTTTVPSSSGVSQINHVTIGGAVVAGEIYRITIGSTTISYTVLLGDTPTIVASALVSLFNASVDAGFTPITASSAVGVVILTADVVNTPFTQTSSAVGVAQKNTITVGGAIDAGDQFSATIASTTVTYIAVLGDTSSIVAAGLKALIDAASAFTTVVTSSIITNVITLTANAVSTPFTQTSSSTNTADTGGTVLIKMRNEGLVGNGAAILSGTQLVKGYAGVFAAGSVDSSKYVLRILRGTHKGLDPISGRPWDDVADIDCVPEMIVQSPEVSTVTELIAWMQSDGSFNQEFLLQTSTVGLDDFFPSDIALYGGLNLASGGTEIYSNTAFDAILDIIVEHDYSFILSDRYNADVEHLYNTKFQTHIGSEAKFNKMLIIGGGNDLATFQTNSLNAAANYNDDNVVICHGGIKLANRNAPTGFDTQDSIFKSTFVCGRIAGLPPQVPVTFKGLKYQAERHVLTVKEQEKALAAGVLYTIKDREFKKFIVAQGINTLQNNDNFINENGTSYSIQIKRIVAQVNKEIIVNAKLQLFGNPAGVNQNTLSAQTIADWLKGYLKSRTAKPTKDDLIIGYDTTSIVVERVQDAWFVKYGFSPNGEITKMFFTGFMLN